MQFYFFKIFKDANYFDHVDCKYLNLASANYTQLKIQVFGKRGPVFNDKNTFTTEKMPTYQIKKKIKLSNWVLQPKTHPVCSLYLNKLSLPSLLKNLQPKQTLLVLAKFYVLFTLIASPTYRTTCWSNWRRLGWTNGTWWSFIKIQNGLLSKKDHHWVEKK